MSFLRRALLTSLVLVTGCPSTAPPPNPEGQAYTFPHPADFGESGVHGRPWIESPEGCVQCHGGEQGLRFVDRCVECHPRYPHPARFSQGDLHGKWGANGGLGCTPCHGTGEARPAEQADSACRDCHQDYPHRLTFAEPWVHGPKARENPASCAACHGDDFQGSRRADACFDCHALYPHNRRRRPDDTADGLDYWAYPGKHGAAALAEGNEACGGGCHGADFEGGSSGVACGDCHQPYPHGDDYRLEHREDTTELGEAACTDCHGLSAGFAADFSCTDSCHGGSS